MGFTPLAGLMMGTRSGDIDPAIISYLCDKEGMTAKEVNDYLNKKSGLLGVSGVSSDMRFVEDAAAQGNQRAKLALEMLTKQIVKLIGAYAAEMNGVDAIVFTAGIGAVSYTHLDVYKRQIDYKCGFAYIKEKPCSQKEQQG